MCRSYATGEILVRVSADDSKINPLQHKIAHIRPRCQHTVRSFGRGNTGAHPCQARGQGQPPPSLAQTKGSAPLLCHNHPMPGSHLCFRDRCQQGCWHRAYRGEADEGKVPVILFPAERARHGRRAPVLQAEHECVAPPGSPACPGNKGAIQASRAQPIPKASLSWRVSAFPAGTCGTAIDQHI